MFSARATACLVVVFATLARADVMLESDSILNYVPNLAGNVIFGVLYTILAFTLFYHVFFTGVKADKWALVLPIGCSFEALGFWFRVILRTNQANEPIYIVMYLFVILSPASFLAFNYILFGRFTAALEGYKPSQVKARSHYSFLPPRMVKIIFVTSDVITFLIQAAGGGLQTSHMYSTMIVGNHIFLAGTVLQAFSYIVFVTLTIVAHVRLYQEDRQHYGISNIYENTALQLMCLLYISSIGILTRSGYRIAEFSQGYGGYLYSHEIFTFVLDGLPLVIAIGVWALFWPGLWMREIRNQASEHKAEQITNEEASRPSSTIASVA
ncbi:hypothetical protein CBS101457_006423 [Exobasidium rhododendri]|nr:hypothetical protein CBS101457_006423 [Exobasidium rhododendri]